MHSPPTRVSGHRRANIAEYLETRNATVGQIARRFFAGESAETARKKASRWLCKQRRRNRVHVRGIVLFKPTGRPEHVYGRRCKEDHIEHEVWITEAELLLGVEFQRNAAVGQTVADAAFVKEGTRFFVEIDNGTMTAKQMKQKWARYGEVSGFILVICHTETRLKRLIVSAELVKNSALFVQFEQLREPAITEPWTDWYGHRTSL